MPDYGTQVSPQDRWAIVAYVKALQLSQAAKTSDVAPGSRVDSLSDIADREGLTPDQATDWRLPPTAVYGTPNNQDNGIPELPAGSKGAMSTSAGSNQAMSAMPSK